VQNGARVTDPGGTLHDAIERWLRRAERVGYEPGGADDLLAALREHLSAHPEAIEELCPTTEVLMVGSFVRRDGSIANTYVDRHLHPAIEYAIEHGRPGCPPVSAHPGEPT
jgi:hypothetical protein